MRLLVPRTSELYDLCGVGMKSDGSQRSQQVSSKGSLPWRFFSDDFASGSSHTDPSSFFASNNDSSIIASVSRYESNGSGELWMKPTIEYIEDEVKIARSKVSGGVSPRKGTSRRKHKRPPKPDQQRRQQQTHWNKAKRVEENVRTHRNLHNYSIKYTIMMKSFVPFMDGRWLGIWCNTIYWIPVHDHNRMKMAASHYQDSLIKSHYPSIDAKFETPLERNKRMDEYADVFARLPENAMIESMYALDGNVYGIATDLVITLVKLLPPSIMKSINVKGSQPSSIRGDGTIWQWMIWSISSSSMPIISIPVMSSTTSSSSTTQSSSSFSGIHGNVTNDVVVGSHPMSVWTLPDNISGVEMFPFCIDAAAPLANALNQQLRYKNKNNIIHTSDTTINDNIITHIAPSSSLSLSGTIVGGVGGSTSFLGRLPDKGDESILRFTVLPKAPPPPPKPRPPPQEEDLMSLFD
jgi:hypothetical protein